MDNMQLLLVANFEKKNHPLSQLVKDSLIGLDVIETLEALGQARRGELECA